MENSAPHSTWAFLAWALVQGQAVGQDSCWEEPEINSYIKRDRVSDRRPQKQHHWGATSPIDEAMVAQVGPPRWEADGLRTLLNAAVVQGLRIHYLKQLVERVERESLSRLPLSEVLLRVSCRQAQVCAERKTEREKEREEKKARRREKEWSSKGTKGSERKGE